MLTQHLGDGEYQVGGGDTFAQLAGQLKADHIRDQHRDRLAEHSGLSFDTPYPPAQHAEAIDHSGMGVRADQRIRVGHPLLILQFTPHRFAEILQIDLVADTGARWDDAEATERLLAPLEKHITFVVTLHLQTHVLFKRIIIAKMVHGHRVVNNQVNRGERVHFCGIAPQAFYRFTHCRQINHRRNAGEILHQHPGRTIGDLPVGVGVLQPSGQGVNILSRNGEVILPAQEVFQ